MTQAEFREFMHRAAGAGSVAELRAVADAARAAHPDDYEADLIDDTCLQYAAALIERQPALRARLRLT